MTPVPGAQIVQDSRLRDRIQCRERFVQQQHSWTRHQRTRQRNPLPFSSRNFARAAAEQARRYGTIPTPHRCECRARPGQRSQAVLHILLNCHVRKQRQRLQQVRDRAATRRKIYARLRVEEYRLADRNRSVVRRLQPSNAVQQCGLAGAGGSEQNGKAGRHFKLDLERELGVAFATKTFFDAAVSCSPGGAAVTSFIATPTHSIRHGGASRKELRAW